MITRDYKKNAALLGYWGDADKDTPLFTVCERPRQVSCGQSAMNMYCLTIDQSTGHFVSRFPFGHTLQSRSKCLPLFPCSSWSVHRAMRVNNERGAGAQRDMAGIAAIDRQPWWTQQPCVKRLFSHSLSSSGVRLIPRPLFELNNATRYQLLKKCLQESGRLLLSEKQLLQFAVFPSLTLNAEQDKTTASVSLENEMTAISRTGIEHSRLSVMFASLSLN